MCKRNNVPVNHLARQIQPNDFKKFDYIFGMECVLADSTNNVRNLQRMQPAGSKAKCVIQRANQGDAILRVVSNC